jgi:hypothetical protein
MKVIKHGKKEFTATCPRCGCVFSYTIEELCGRWPLKYMLCPDCEEEVYHKEQETEAIPDVNISTGGDYAITCDNCPQCGTPMFCDHSVVYTTNPPQYKQICPKCGFSRYKFGGTYNDYSGTAVPYTHKYDSVTISKADGSNLVGSSELLNNSTTTSVGVWNE